MAEVNVRVLSKMMWSPKLFSFTTTRPDNFRFDAGQFVRLGIDGASEPIFRAYSIVSSPYDEFLEFFSVVVPEGAFTSKLQHLAVGDNLYLDTTAYGFLTLARYQNPPPNDLWLLATGTGLAPFLSMLGDLTTWERYRHIVLAYSVSFAQDLAYLTRIKQLVGEFQALTEQQTTFTFLPIVTQEQDTAAQLHQRLPTLLISGALETAAGRALDPATSHIMLCGNPAMVHDLSLIHI